MNLSSDSILAGDDDPPDLDTFLVVASPPEQPSQNKPLLGTQEEQCVIVDPSDLQPIVVIPQEDNSV